MVVKGGKRSADFEADVYDIIAIHKILAKKSIDIVSSSTSSHQPPLLFLQHSGQQILLSLLNYSRHRDLFDNNVRNMIRNFLDFGSENQLSTPKKFKPNFIESLKERCLHCYEKFHVFARGEKFFVQGFSRTLTPRVGPLFFWL